MRVLIGLAAMLAMVAVGTAASNPHEGASITVADGIWGQTTIATVVAPDPPPNSTANYVLATCFDADATLIWGGFFPITDGRAEIGPFIATTWADPSPAHCGAEVVFFRRDGFGKQVAIADTTFEVTVGSG